MITPQGFSNALNYLRLNVNPRLSIRQMIVLLTIMQREGITQHELSIVCRIKQGTMSKICRTFDKADIIKRKQSAKNHRQMACYLDVKGRLIKKHLAGWLEGRF